MEKIWAKLWEKEMRGRCHPWEGLKNYCILSNSRRSRYKRDL